MKKITLTSFFLLTILTAVLSQGPKTALVYQESRRAFLEIAVDKNGLIAFTTVPDSIIVFIGANASGRILQFNKDSTAFYLSMDAKEKEEIPVMPYLNQGKMTLVFRNNELMAINQTLIAPRKLLTDKEGRPYIVLLSNKVAVGAPAKSPCTESVKKDSSRSNARITARNHITDTISFLPQGFTIDQEEILELVKQFDPYPGSFPKNYIIHDTRTGSTRTFSVNRKDGKTVLKPFNAKVKNHITTLIISSKKEKPVLHINETDFLLSEQTTFENAVGGLLNTPESKADEKVSLTETDTTETKTPETTNTEKQKKIAEQLVNKFTLNKKQTDKIIDSLSKELEHCINCTDTLKKQIASLTLTRDSLKKKIADLLSGSTTLTELKEKLLALERDLEKFNATFKNSIWASPYYNGSLLYLRLQIKKTFQIPVTADGHHLFGQLVNILKSIPEHENFMNDFCGLLEAIKNEYQLASHQFDSVFVHEHHHIISNKDQLTVSLKANDKETVLVDIGTNGGLKIDFASGFFFHGINNSSYSQTKQPFRYKEEKLSVDTITGQVTTAFTGAIKDTSGLLIYKKTKKINYSAAFLANIYTRPSGSVNLALSLGFMLNNNDNSFPLNLMCGGSILFRSGKSRIAVSSGVIWGKRAVLPVEARPYIWNREADPANSLYNSKYDVPKFVDGDIRSDYKGAFSWYFGLSFSFASTGK